MTVVTIVVILGIDRGCIGVEVVHIVSIVVRRRPEVPVGAQIVHRARVEVAGEGYKQVKNRGKGKYWYNPTEKDSLAILDNRN